MLQYRVLQVKSRISTTCYRITMAHVRHSLYLAVGQEMSPKTDLSLGGSRIPPNNSQFLIKSHNFKGYKLSTFLASHLPVICLTLHIQSVITACAQTLYALRVLHKHGLCDDSLHDIFCAVTVAKLMYASNAWWGFSNSNDRQKIFAFIRHCIRTGFCSPDLANFHDLCISLDEKLFNKILENLNLPKPYPTDILVTTYCIKLQS